MLKTIYSDQSPYKDYNLIICGHSLGAGCASIVSISVTITKIWLDFADSSVETSFLSKLSLMLRPSFPSLHCFAYEVSGLYDMCEIVNSINAYTIMQTFHVSSRSLLDASSMKRCQKKVKNSSHLL